MSRNLIYMKVNLNFDKDYAQISPISLIHWIHKEDELFLEDRDTKVYGKLGWRKFRTNNIP